MFASFCLTVLGIRIPSSELAHTCTQVCIYLYRSIYISIYLYIYIYIWF